MSEKEYLWRCSGSCNRRGSSPQPFVDMKCFSCGGTIKTERTYPPGTIPVVDEKEEPVMRHSGKRELQTSMGA